MSWGDRKRLEEARGDIKRWIAHIKEKGYDLPRFVSQIPINKGITLDVKEFLKGLEDTA
ncbi:MAG TPA: hypothetical protein VJH90_00190 [archaeon]|nr:hypothetical protein [archaeon]